MATRIIDVSAAQGPNIDWDKVKAYALVAGCICKGTEGNGFPDPTFDRNFKECKRVGLIRGGYSFARPDVHPGDAIQEADLLISTMRKAGAFDDPHEPLFIVLDMENSPLKGKEFQDWCLTWLEHIEEETSVIPWLYSGGPFLNEHLGKMDSATIQRFRRFPLWLAAYVNAPNSFLPVGWDHYDLWQRSGDVAASGQKVLHVPGIGGASTNVDCDEYPGTVEELKALLLSLRTFPVINPPSFPDSAVTLIRAGEGEHTPNYDDLEETNPGTPTSISQQAMKAVRL